MASQSLHGVASVLVSLGAVRSVCERLVALIVLTSLCLLQLLHIVVHEVHAHGLEADHNDGVDRDKPPDVIIDSVSDVLSIYTELVIDKLVDAVNDTVNLVGAEPDNEVDEPEAETDHIGQEQALTHLQIIAAHEGNQEVEDD